MAGGSKDRIQEVAGELLARDGYNGMGLKAISSAAGLPYGSIYHHFPGGKEEIAAAAIEGVSSHLARLLAGLLTGGVTDGALRAMFEFMADRLEASDWVDGCPVGTPALDGSAQSPAVRRACDEGLDRMVEVVASALAGDGHEPARARELATVLVAGYEGATLLARAQRSRAPLDVACDAMIRLLHAEPR